VPWKTWREKKLAKESSAWSRREAVSEGGSFVAAGLALIIGVIGALVAMTVGIDLLARWMMGLLSTPPVPALIAAGMVLFAGWGLVRIATGHSPPVTSRRDQIIAVLVLILCALIGVAVFVAGIAPQAPDSPGF
jgi:hypothetical protein